MFHFSGELSVSKSWMNRALILQSFDSQLQIQGSSLADDVVCLQKALTDFKQGQKLLFAGLGGTTFRFLAFRVSRMPGRYEIQADPQLMKRPQKEISSILSQLGVATSWTDNSLIIDSKGWIRPSQPLQISTEESSQFLSAFALSCVDLEFPIEIAELPTQFKSQSYFKMTQQLLEKCGVQWGLARQKITPQLLIGEADVSSAVSLIAAAVLKGRAHIVNWPRVTDQPDVQILNFLQSMQIQYRQDDQGLFVEQQNSFHGIKADISDCPDVFPVLSVLCAFAKGNSTLYNAPHLKLKESNRIEKTVELLSRCGFSCQALEDGISITGQPESIYKAKDLIHFNPAHDHRMAMAAAILKLKGFPLIIHDAHVINKSYHQFYQHIGVQP